MGSPGGVKRKVEAQVCQGREAIGFVCPGDIRDAQAVQKRRLEWQGFLGNDESSTELRLKLCGREARSGFLVGEVPGTRGEREVNRVRDSRCLGLLKQKERWEGQPEVGGKDTGGLVAR